MRGLLKLLNSRQVQLVQTAGAKRGPKRYLGNTKSQWLDKLMRTNANICALITVSFFPIVAYYSWWFMQNNKARKAAEEKQTEDLLAEGKAIA